MLAETVSTLEEAAGELFASQARKARTLVIKLPEFAYELALS